MDKKEYYVDVRFKINAKDQIDAEQKLEKVINDEHYVEVLATFQSVND